MRIFAPAAFVALSLLCACQQNAPMNKPEAVHGCVTDMNAFEQFIAGKPTPAQFKAAYPDVQLVQPGEITTREFRLNNSRYFAKFDADGRISGGKFM